MPDPRLPAAPPELRRVSLTDPLAAPLVRGLTDEYDRRYGAGAGARELARYPAAEFEPPSGLLLVLLDAGEAVAGGALRRYGEGAAELKRIWTAPGHRRRGHARRVLVELERAAAALGHERLLLTTGTAQPEAVALYLATGWTPLFDPARLDQLRGEVSFERAVTRGE